ncbi:Uncharacterised protein [Mycobacteroides abscessus subsp. abscessus]|nr:Uncharacterised protein [Mycobacteroides abscessus subsp. abscessus]
MRNSVTANGTSVVTSKVVIENAMTRCTSSDSSMSTGSSRGRTTGRITWCGPSGELG